MDNAHPIIKKIMEAEELGMVVPEDVFIKFGTALQQKDGNSIKDYLLHIAKVMFPASLMNDNNIQMICLYKIMTVGYYIGKGLENAPDISAKEEVEELLKTLKLRRDKPCSETEG
jgi:hypothetical protein